MMMDLLLLLPRVVEWLAPTVISSLIAGGVGLATHFSSQAAQKHENREDIRTEAFDQAKAFYTDVIERQDKEVNDLREQKDREIADLRRQVAEAMARAADAEVSAESCRAAVRRLTQEVRERDARIIELTQG